MSANRRRSSDPLKLLGAAAFGSVLGGCGTTYLPLNVQWQGNNSVSAQQFAVAPAPTADVVEARSVYIQAFEVCHAAERVLAERDEANRRGRITWTVVGGVVAAVGGALTAAGEIRDGAPSTPENSQLVGYLKGFGGAAITVGGGVVLLEQFQETRAESYHETLGAIRSAMDSAEDAVADVTIPAARIRTVAMSLLQRCTRNPSEVTAIGVPTSMPTANTQSPVINALRRRCSEQRNNSAFCR